MKLRGERERRREDEKKLRKKEGVYEGERGNLRDGERGKPGAVVDQGKKKEKEKKKERKREKERNRKREEIIWGLCGGENLGK